MLITTLIGRVSRYMGIASNSTPLRQTNFLSLAVAQMEGYNTEAARAGRRFYGGTTIIANGIAPVAAIPTVTATLALYNADPVKCLCIDRVNVNLLSGTAAAGLTLYVAVSPLPIAAPPVVMGTGYGVSSASGSKLGSNAMFTTALTMPAPAGGTLAWQALLTTLQPAGANVGQGDVWCELAGGIVIPPLRALGMGILSGTGTSPLYGVSLGWSEFELDVE